MSETNSETSTKLAEMVRLAEEKEREEKLQREEETKTQNEKQAEDAVGKIERDRLEQNANQEILANDTTEKQQAKESIDRIQKELAEIHRTKEQAQSKIDDLEISDTVKEIYRSVVSEADAAEDKLRTENLQHEETLAGNRSKETNDAANKTNNEAAEVLGYDRKTREIKDYFDEQREFLTAPERFKEQIDILADKIVKDNLKRISETARERRAFETRHYATYVSSRPSERSEEVSEAVSRSRNRNKTYDESAREAIKKQTEFISLLAKNSLLVKALDEKRKEKVEELLKNIENPSSDKYKYPSLKPEDLKIVKERLQKHPVDIGNSTIWLGIDTVQKKPEFFENLAEEDQQKIDAAVANPNKSFQDVARELGLKYNELALEQIQTEAQQENKEFNTEKRKRYLEREMEKNRTRLAEVKANREIYDMAIEHDKLEDEYDTRRQLEDGKTDTIKHLEKAQVKLQTIEKDTNFLGIVKDRRGRDSALEDVNRIQKEIAEYDEKIKKSENGRVIDFETLKTQYEESTERLLKELLLHQPSQYTWNIKSPKSRSDIKNPAEYIRAYMRERKAIDEYDRTSEQKAAEDLKKQETEYEILNDGKN